MMRPATALLTRRYVVPNLRPDAPYAKKKGKTKGRGVLGGILDALLKGGRTQKGKERSRQAHVMLPRLRNPVLVRPPMRFVPRAVTPDGRPVRVAPGTLALDPLTGRRGSIADLQWQRTVMRTRTPRPIVLRGRLPPAASRAWRYPTRPEKPSRLRRWLKNEGRIWLGTWYPGSKAA